MKNHNRTWRFSQLLAVIVPAAAVCVMAAPFRGQPEALKTRAASVVPLLATASLAHSSSFQACSLRERINCSVDALFRSAAEAKHSHRREILIRKAAAAIPVDFKAPRVGWRHLGRAERAKLDLLAGAMTVHAVELRSTETASGGISLLERRARLLGERDGVAWQRSLVIGNGRGMEDGRVHAGAALGGDSPPAQGPLALYLVGDFNRDPATQAQWEALDEVIDYLALKWGRVRVVVRPGGGATEPNKSGLGWMFPTETLLRTLSAANAPAG